MSDDLVKRAREWREDGSPSEPFYATGHLIDAMADRIEQLEAKLEAAIQIIDAYGEDEGYMPRRVEHLCAQLTGGNDG